jgi:hypothetical protein
MSDEMRACDGDGGDGGDGWRALIPRPTNTPAHGADRAHTHTHTHTHAPPLSPRRHKHVARSALDCDEREKLEGRAEGRDVVQLLKLLVRHLVQDGGDWQLRVLHLLHTHLRAVARRHT